MKKILITIIGSYIFIGCQEKQVSQTVSSVTVEQTSLKLEIDEARKIIDLPMHCLTVEYPNKLGQVLASEIELKSPKELRPIFYGCFDWHSSAHGYWSVVKLVKQFPELEDEFNITKFLSSAFTKNNVEIEKAFFEQPHNKNFERTYGWAWFFKLQEELFTWKDNPVAMQWYQTLKPLEDIFTKRYLEYLPKLNYPIRTGTHDNTAFGMALTLEYAEKVGNNQLREAIIEKAKELYTND